MSNHNEVYVIAFGNKYLSGPPNDFPKDGFSRPEKLVDYAAKFTSKDEALNVAKIMKRAEGKSIDAPVKLIKITVEEVDING